MKTNQPFLFCLFILAFVILGFERCYLWTPEKIDAPCPILLDIVPDGAHFNDTVTIKGTGFLKDSPELYIVSINGQEIPKDSVVAVPDVNSLRFVVPKGAQNGPIAVSIVNNPDCKANLNKPFTYYYEVANTEIFAGVEGQTVGDDRFYSPQGLDVDNDGNVIVADRKHYVIKQIKLTDRTVSKIAGNGQQGWQEGNGLLASFYQPMDVAFDKETQNIYVADLGDASKNNVIWKIAPGVNRKTNTISGDPNIAGGSNGTSVKSALYDGPSGIATDHNGFLYVTERYGHRLRKLNIKGDNVQTMLGDTNLPGNFNPLHKPAGVAYSDKRDVNFPIFLTDLDTQQVYSVPLTGQAKNLLKGQSFFIAPNDVAVDASGNVYVVDSEQRKIFVFYTNDHFEELKVNYNFDHPVGITIDKNRNLIYVSDEYKSVVIQVAIE